MGEGSLSPELRDLFARMRVRIEDLEREKATLLAENQRLKRPAGPRPGGNLMYRTEAARLAARRKSWRESQRRRKEKLRGAA